MLRIHRISLAAMGCLLFSGSLAFAQVFTQAEGAVEGYTPFGTGQALYGGFGLESATSPEFNIYRKFLERDEQEPLSSATNVDGNPGEAHWINVNQRQGAGAGANKYVLTAPGMFIGQKNHVTEDGWVVSNPDEILYFKPLIDTEMDQTGITDSNRNAFWDTRFGFFEDPDSYLDFVQPNSNQLDLWTGRFDTDAIYAQTFIRRDDSGDNTNVTTTQGHQGSFKLMAGDPDTEIADERGRDNYPLTRQVLGAPETELDPSGHIDAGVAYEDPIEVSWGMRLADPDSNDDIDARSVEFWIKTGNIVSSGTFDPGDEDNLPFDPPNANDFVDYTDEYFDWQNAVPVFFAGAQGLVAGEGNMGIFVPGDFGADGSVNLDDFNRLAADYGSSATTYSRGDFTQDGITDMADAEAWAGLASEGVKTEVFNAVQGDLGGSMYDFDGNGSTGEEDVTFISELLGVDGGCTPGNGDLDGNGKVEFADFLVLSGNFGQEADAAGGDIDCNGTVEFADFLVLSGAFGTDVGAAQSVPEPQGMLIFAFGAVAFGLLRKRRK